jgi:hypothetical protein
VTSYVAAVECARVMGQVRQFELAKRLGIDWRVANVFLQRMQHDGIVGRMDARGWRSVSESHSDVHMPNPVIGAAADARQEASRDARFDAIRRLIAKELHPDSGHAEEDGKELFTQMFQRIWPQIQEISRSLA